MNHPHIIPHPEGLEAHTKEGKLIRELVFGVQDGIVTVMGIIAGVSVTGNKGLILLSAIAGLLGETVSMTLGGYLSTKSQNEFYNEEIRKERAHLDKFPEHEKNEVREFYAGKGIKGRDLETIVRIVTASKDRWIEVMRLEEFNFPKELDRPIIIGGVIGLASIIGGFIPVIPYLFPLLPQHAFFLSMGMALLALFAGGAARSYFTRKNWVVSGLEMAFIGIVAALAAFAIGKLLTGGGLAY